MKDSFSLTILILIPVLLILNEDIRWEKSALRSIESIGDFTSARTRLRAINRDSDSDYEAFRLRQLLIIALTLIPMTGLFLFSETSIITIFLYFLLVTAAIIFITERNLTARVRQYQSAIESDFPAIVEMVTLSLSAGETPLSALQRISHRGDSPLSKEFSRVVADVRRGIPFVQALDEMGRRMHAVAIRRFIDAVVVAISRGAPLIEVLHSHAREARDFQREKVLSAAGKAEISMMIPVVFLILPISILFALWPSLSGLDIFVSQ
jgi:tight adherence protein C